MHHGNPLHLIHGDDPVDVRANTYNQDALVTIGATPGPHVILAGDPDHLRQVFTEVLSGLIDLCMSVDERQSELFADAEDAA